MNNKYDSILKEKKKYEEVIDERHFLRKHLLIIDTFAIITILIISFIIYFYNVLTPPKMIYDNFIDFLNSIDIVYKNILLTEDFEGKYNFNGEVDIGLETNYDNEEDTSFLKNLNFKYSILDDGNDKNISIDSEKYKFNYSETNNKGYLNYDENFIEYNISNSKTNLKNYEDILKIIEKTMYDEIKKLDMKKSAFVNDGKLIVSVDLNIDGNYINNLYTKIISQLENNNIVIPEFINKEKIVSDSSKYKINIKNDLLKNDLVNLKIIINDNEYRGVLTYQEDTFTYKDDNNEYKCVLKINDNDFSFRLYEKEDMKYIFAGSGNDKSYTYTYQVINVIDNMSLQIKKDNNKNNYILTIKKEQEDRYFNLLINASLNYNNYVSIDKNTTNNSNYKKYSNLEKEEKKDIDNYIYRLYNSLYNLFKYVK